MRSKIQSELKKKMDDEAIADTCSFKPKLVSKRTYKQQSMDDRRDFKKFYNDMLKPISSVASKIEQQKFQDNEAVKKEKAEFLKGK